MEPTLKGPTTPRSKKPYSRPTSTLNSPSDTKPLLISSPLQGHISTTPTNSPGKSRPWNAEELKALFRFAVKHGAPGSDKAWEGVVEGRSGSQCRNAWRHRLVNLIEKALEEKATRV